MDRRTVSTWALVGVVAVGTIACGDDDTADTSASSAPPGAVSTAEPSATTSPRFLVTEFDGGATYLTGRIEDFTLDEGTVETDADGLEHSRDGTVSYRLVTDDPRVTGTVTGTWNSDRWGPSVYDGAMTQWGTATLTNEQGTWAADYAGAFASPVGDILVRWWRGTGAYDGLTFFMWTAGSEPGVASFEVGGIIFPGDPPPTVTP